jgi:hypothetical protein
MRIAGQTVQEVSSRQRALIECLVRRGFTQVAFPLYANAIGMRRGDFAALLVPDEEDGFQMLGRAYYLLHGKPSVRIRRDGREWFVCKDVRLEATSELLTELERFADELTKLLQTDI